jgi:hypothetical protein
MPKKHPSLISAAKGRSPENAVQRINSFGW